MVRLKQLEQDTQHPLGGYYSSALCSRPNSLSQQVIPTIDILLKSLPRKTKSKAETNIANAVRHRIAERHRRKRICQQYDILRSILPNLIKMDKASVLGETIRQVRELKKRLKETKAVCRGSLEGVLPGESDNLSLGYCESDGSLLKATFSCDDRAELISDLTRAVRTVNGRVVRAEMVFVGGRNKSVLWVKGLSGNEGICMLKRALKMAVDRPKMKNGKPRFTH
ncbi:Basic helix-loop-helix DNA-binding superfamily protein, putative [Theobroma cacao]|uniref:Basic helix-loop-helix DNA-binding superfamily protein, putative n=1 Tax=Theobroma cacao TaxID=3641 RepID=A0A061DHI9_THECC|nr:Basic helix-loop-helix DNA-binding superfamily protein, putative [Theobroma cacao]